MKRIARLAAALVCLWQISAAAADGQMDYLPIENRIQDEWTQYVYSYPQITRGESKVTEQRLNGFLREYSQSTPLQARLTAKKESRRLLGKTTFEVMRNDASYFSVVFTSQLDGRQWQKGFVFLPQNGSQLRLEDLFVTPEFSAVLSQATAAWRQSNAVADGFPSVQDFYLTADCLILLFSPPDGGDTLSCSIPLDQIASSLREDLIAPVS